MGIEDRQQGKAILRYLMDRVVIRIPPRKGVFGNGYLLGSVRMDGSACGWNTGIGKTAEGEDGMLIRLHGSATATPAKRTCILPEPSSADGGAAARAGSGLPDGGVVEGASDGQDGSSRPHRMHASLADWQEKLVVELRTTMLLPLDDLLAVVRKVMRPTLTRSALNRCPVRHGAGSLRALRARLEDKPTAAGRRFKDYASGFLHIDIKYLPRMSDETPHRYLFVAIDRATRWVHAEILADKSARSAAAFVARLTAAFPGKIYRILTDNGKEFSDRFTRSGERTSPDSTPSTGNAGNWTSTTASSPCESRRPTAWSNASTDASPKSPETTASTTSANCAPPSATTSIHTTTSSPSSRSDIAPRTSPRR